MAASTYAIETAFAVNGCISIICIILFSILRRLKWSRKFYSPKRRGKQQEKPKKLPSGIFSWICVVWSYPEEEIIRVAGLDSALYLRIFTFALEVFFWVSVWVCISVLPANLSGGYVKQALEDEGLTLKDANGLDHRAEPIMPPPRPSLPPMPPGYRAVPVVVNARSYLLTSFDLFSLTNIPAGSNLLWVHVASIYVVTMIVLTILWRYNKESVRMRVMYLARMPRGGASHTVLLSDIPGVFYGTVPHKLRQFVGSTVFRFLPQSIRVRILDAIEDGIDTMNRASHGVIKAIASAKTLVKKKVPPTSVPSTPVAKVAASSNTMIPSSALDEAKSESNYANDCAASVDGSTTAPVDFAADTEEALLESFDPWVHAREVLRAGYSVKEMVEQEMRLVYTADAVATVNPVISQTKIEPLLKEYYAVCQALEDYLDTCTRMLRCKMPIKRKTITVYEKLPGYLFKVAMQRDAIEYWCEKLKQLMSDIQAEQNRAKEVFTPSAFVTFNYRTAQVTAATTLHHHDESVWNMCDAPQPEEIVWSSVKLRSWEKRLREFVTNNAFIALCVFYYIPIAAVQGMIDLPNLVRHKSISPYLEHPVVLSLLEVFLPGLVLRSFLIFLPEILQYMAHVAGSVSVSTVDFFVMRRFYIFMVTTVFSGSLITGTIFSQLLQFISSPTYIVAILGEAVPQSGTFFISYTLVQGLLILPICFLRIPQLILYNLRVKMATTRRARQRLQTAQYTTYGRTVVLHTMVILFGLVFSSINPIISLACILYFIFNNVFERYQNLYVFSRTYESGGRLWQHVSLQIMVALYIMQAFMLILLYIKEFWAAAILLPCLAITLLYHIASRKVFSGAWKVQSLHDAALMDARDEETAARSALSEAEKDAIEQIYKSPAHKLGPADLRPLLIEASIVSRRINGESLAQIQASMDRADFLIGDDSDAETEVTMSSVVHDPSLLSQHTQSSAPVDGDTTRSSAWVSVVVKKE